MLKVEQAGAMMVVRLDQSNLFNTISKVYHIALLVYNGEGAVLERFSSNPENDEILLVDSHCKERLFDLCRQNPKPQIISSEINQLWAGVPVLDENRIDEVIVLGPVHTSETSRTLAIEYVHSRYFSSRHKDELIAALEQIPVYPYSEFTRLLALIYSLICGEALDISALTITGLARSEVALADKLHPYQEGKAEKEDIFQLTYDFEQYFLECVREGNLESLKRLLKTASYNVIALNAKDDPIRQQKNMFIVSVALATRAAIEGGLNPQIAYALSDLYIQQVETMYSFPAILRLHREMLYEITTRVGNLKRPYRYSKLVNDCCDFIDEHIRENLRITDVAAFVGFNPHYVSRKFREETGQSIGSYIKEAKISEAKLLLRYSELSLAEIGELLSFSSQSFFTAIFRQVVGVTPGQYRKDMKK